MEDPTLEVRLALVAELPAVLELDDLAARFAELDVVAEAVSWLRSRVAAERGRVVLELRVPGTGLERSFAAVGELLGISGERARQLAALADPTMKETSP